MRFLLRTVFWLGLTFHAMPWGDARWSDALPDARAALGAAHGDAGPRREGAPPRSPARSCALRSTRSPRPRRRARQTTRASVDTLSPADRLPPWRGPGLRGAI